MQIKLFLCQLDDIYMRKARGLFQSKVTSNVNIEITDEPSRVLVNKLVQLLSKRKLTERTKSAVKHSFPKSPKIRDSSENYKAFHVNFLRRYDCFFSTVFR